MTNLPEPKELHERAATSAKETRSTIISLSTASIGGLFFIATKPAEAVQFTGNQKFFILATITFMVMALGSAIWFAYCDAQWSYYWGSELDEERPARQRADFAQKKLWWHNYKNKSERSMLACFFLAALFGGIFVVARVF